MILRIPPLISRFLPFSALLGTLIAFVTLNQNSEVVAMKAAGLSAHQILAPLIIASLVLAGALFAFNETVVVKSARVVTAWSDNDYKPIPPESGILSRVWLLQGDDLIKAGIVSGHPPIFRSSKLPSTTAAAACCSALSLQRVHCRRPREGDWLLQDVRVYDANMNVVRRASQMPAMRGVTPNQLTLAKVDPNDLDYWTLRSRIGRARSGRAPD